MQRIVFNYLYMCILKYEYYYLKASYANRVFSRDVTVAMLMSLNKGTAAMLVSPTNPSGTELNSYANVFFCFD